MLTAASAACFQGIAFYYMLSVSEDILKETEIKTAKYTGDEEQHKYLNVLIYIIFNRSLQRPDTIRDAILVLCYPL